MKYRHAIAATVLMAVSSHALPGISGDFNGAYGGFSVGVGTDPWPSMDHSVDVFVGHNTVVHDNFLLGGEVVVNGNHLSLWGTNVVTGKLEGRLGYLATDDVLLYGRAGGGYTTGGSGSLVWDMGAGAEIDVFDKYTARVEVERIEPFDAGMLSQVNGKLGLVFDF